MKKVALLLAVLALSVAWTAACSKSDNSSSNSSATTSATTAATAAPNAMAAANPLPIPLSKLPNAKVAAGDPAAGAKVYAANCESCHGAGGKNGTVGPSLAGAGLKPGQVAYMVMHPQAIDSSSGMPKLPLSPKDVTNVAAYVASLK